MQIQAICQYGDVRLKSEKTSLYLDTFTLPLSDMQGKIAHFNITCVMSTDTCKVYTNIYINFELINIS